MKGGQESNFHTTCGNGGLEAGVMGDIGTLVDVVGGQIWPTGSKQNHFQIQVLETSHDLFKTFTNEHCNSKCTMWLWEKCVLGADAIDKIWK